MPSPEHPVGPGALFDTSSCSIGPASKLAQHYNLRLCPRQLAFAGRYREVDALRQRAWGLRLNRAGKIDISVLERARVL